MKRVIIATSPCYNEGAFIGDIVCRTSEHVDQVIVIDDGSHDGTAEVARAAGALVIVHKENHGAGGATRSGIEAAKVKNADIVVTLDGDNQHAPEEIPNLVAPILEGRADLVIGSRFLGGNNKIPRYRKFGIKVITWLFNVGSWVKISDAQRCFRAHSRRLLDAFSITESGFGFSVEVLIKARGGGFAIHEVPISCLYHSESSTANPVVHGVGVALTVIKLRFVSLLHRLVGAKGT